MKVLKRKIKQQLFNFLHPYGFTVDGVKPPGYIEKRDLQYKRFGYKNLRDYFNHKWNAKVDVHCDKIVDYFLINRLNGDERVVEIGTGVGFFTHSLLKSFPSIEYHSFELDKKLSTYLSEAFKSYQFKSHFTDGARLKGLSSQSMDLAVAFGVFTYVNFSTIVQYLKEFQRVLQPGGLLLFDIFDTDERQKGLISNFLEYSLKGDNRPFLSAKMLEDILSDMGFVLLDTNRELDGDDYETLKLLFQKGSQPPAQY